MFSKFLKNYRFEPDGRVYLKSTNKLKETWKDKHGYECYTLTYAPYKKQNIFKHRLVLWLNKGNPPNDEQVFVNHIDGNPLNNDITNLEWCSRRENEQHKYKTLQHRRLSLRKFNTEQIKEMRKLYRENISIYRLSKIYACSNSTMRDIIFEKTYNKKGDY